MFFATTAPASLRRQAYTAAGRSLERFLQDAQVARHQAACSVSQDEKAYTLSFDVPGIAKEQLNVGIEGSIVRIESKEGAARHYRQAYELPQEIDVAGSEAKLENGVLTLKLAKQLPASRVIQLNVH